MDKGGGQHCYKGVSNKWLQVHLLPSKGMQGGGTALVYRDNFTVTPSTLDALDIIEISTYQMIFASTCLWLNALYRPPNTSVIDFCTELTTLIKRHITDRGKAIWVRDFNIDVNDVTNLDTIASRDFLHSFNLKNMVSFLTHKSCHTIDLILQDLDVNIVQDTMRGFMLSDNNFVDYILNVEKPTRPTKMVTFRKLRVSTKRCLKWTCQRP